MVSKSVLCQGSIAFYHDGNPFLLNEYVYVDDEQYGADPNLVSVMTFTSGKLNWTFGARRDKLEVIGFVDPARIIHQGSGFHPEGLKAIAEDVKSAIATHKARGK